MLSCKEATQLLSQGQDRPLALRERLSLRVHLLICEACSNFRRQIDFIGRASRQLLGRDIPPPDR